MTEHTIRPVQLLAELRTSRDVAQELKLSQDRVMRLLERGELAGTRVANRWFVTAEAIAEFRQRRYGAVQDLCRRALQSEGVRLTPKQRAICETLQEGTTMTNASRATGLPRPSLYAQLRLIRRKLEKLTDLTMHSSEMEHQS
jgi:DNA-binding CsgD family transcriptional regulator